MYHNVLGRAAESGAHSYWTNALDTGAITRDHVMLQFSEVAVTMYFATMLRRAPAPAGFSYRGRLLP